VLFICCIPLSRLTGEHSYGLAFVVYAAVKLGCGTAVPTPLLLDPLFAHIASESTDATDPPCSAGDSNVGSMPILSSV